jgi:integrase
MSRARVGAGSKTRGRRRPARDRSGVGSIEVTPSGKFKVRVWVKGKRTGDTHATRDEAERQRAALAVRHRGVAELVPPEPGALTLAAWGKTWLERREELGEVRNAPGDRTRWGQYITGSALDGMALEDIRGKHITGWLDAMVKRPRAKGPGRLAPQTIRHAFNLLRLAFADAMRAEHIDANPCNGAKLPKPKAAAWAFLTADEIALVLAGAPGVLPESQRAFIVATFAGLREGELIALRVADLTLDGRSPEVHVQRSHDGPPKNGKTRRVPLFPEAVEALRAQLAHLAADGGEPADDAVVFPSVRGFQRQPNDDFGWSSRKRRRGAPTGFKAALGITRAVRFHELRHTTASHLAMGTWTSAPWPIQDIAAFMGHGSLAMTQRYMHLAPGYLHDRVRGAREVEAGPGMDVSPMGTRVVPGPIGNTVRPARLERATGGLEGRCSIRLSYGHGTDWVGVEGFEPTTSSSQS